MKIVFHVPPANQGQIVFESYAAVGDYVIRRRFDGSDRSDKYAIAKALAGDEGDYWNRAPRNKRWRAITADEAGRLIAEQEEKYE